MMLGNTGRGSRAAACRDGGAQRTRSCIGCRKRLEARSRVGGCANRGTCGLERQVRAERRTCNVVHMLTVRTCTDWMHSWQRLQTVSVSCRTNRPCVPFHATDKLLCLNAHPTRVRSRDMRQKKLA